MKPSLLLALIFVAILSACAGGNPTPAAPSQQPNQPTPSVQQSNPPAVTLTSYPNPAVANEATTFIASASALVNAALDFGDGTLVTFGPLNSATVKHIYNRRGTFVATVSVTNGAGDHASASTALVVR